MLQRMIERFIRGGHERICDLSTHQHAYRVGRSADSTLHQLFRSIKRDLNAREVGIG